MNRNLPWMLRPLLALLPLAPCVAAGPDVATWSDAAWDAARRGDVAAFEAAVQSCPEDGGEAARAFRSAAERRERNLRQADEARDAAIEKHRADMRRELDGGDITRAMVAAANLKFLLDLDAWNQEMRGETFAGLEARAEAVRAQAERETDWLLAQEMLYRLRGLHEDSDQRERFEALDDMLDASSRRVTFLAEFAPRRLHELRKMQNERFRASQTDEDRAKAARAKARAARGAGEAEEETLDEPFPEYNPLVADDWKEQFSGITPYMLREGLRKAATEHIENGGWKPLIQGGLTALTLLAETPECRETFPGLGDDAKRARWLEALTAARARVDKVPDDAANAVLYREVMSSLLQANHASVDLPESALLHEFGEGATSVLARRFEDPYSEIIWPERLRRFRQQVEGNFVGVGILIRHDQKRDIEIINPLEGSPAARAGLKPGDRIVAVNGQSTTGWSLNRAVDLITGPAGEVVTLTIRREGEERPFEMPLTRESIKMRSVVGWRKTGLDDRGMPTWDWYVDPSLGIGMVRLTSFNDDSYDDFLEAIDAMRRQRTLRGLVLDLRGNPGGLLSSATDFCNLWIPKGELVSTQDRDGRTTSVRRAEANRAALQDLPVVVLVNQSSASAAEILSGCLQAYDKAVIVGDRSFGKGSVQEVSPIQDRNREAAVKVTTQHYVLPPEAGKTGGRLVHKKPGSSDWGVMPDLQVRMTPEQLEKLAELRSLVDTLPEPGVEAAEPRRAPEEIIATGADPQLETALMAIRARVLKDVEPTAVAEAVTPPEAASSPTQTP